MIRRRPSPAAGLRAWQLAFGRPTPPPQKGKAARPGKGETAQGTAGTSDSTPGGATVNGSIDVTLALALAMPRTCAALLTSGGSIRQLAEALPATAAALSGVLLT